MSYIKLLEAAVEDARDVCKYLDAGRIEDAKAHTEFYWDALDKIRDMDEAEKVEPVGQLQENLYGRGGVFWFKKPKNESLLYAEPPQREWVGLTDEEIDEGQKHSWVAKQAFESAVWWAEEKLKEKNT